jgi:hypothetical protein
MKSKPDFFLTAVGEVQGDLAVPRACRTKGRLRDNVRDDYMLVEVEPAIIGQEYGLGRKDITEVLLSSRYQGFSLFPITEWPCDVYIARILDDAVIATSVITANQVEVIAWGRIYRALPEADAEVKKFEG